MNPSIIVVTETWDALGLAMLMERQGSDVLVAYDVSGLKDEKDHDAAERCGEGLINRMELGDAIKRYKGTGALWLFDNNAFPEQADKLRKAGEQVLGTGAMSAKMEKDRAEAAKVAADVGFAQLDTQEFTDATEAVRYLEEHEDTAYVCKAHGGDADRTFVPLPSDDARTANEMLRRYLVAGEDTEDAADHFILQERLTDCVEVNVDLWVHKGKPLVAFVDLEAKRRLNGDLGELVGCGFDYLFQVPVSSPLVRRTAGRFLGMSELRSYTGSVDANVLIKDGKHYWLEACWRFGYNAMPTLLYGLAKGGAEHIFQQWLAGRPLAPLFHKGYAASLSLFAAEHHPGYPVMVPKRHLDDFCPYSLYGTEDGMAMVGGGKAWYAVGCAVGYDPDPRHAGRKALDVAGQIVYPNKGHRTDLAESDLDTLPLARLHSLRQLGLLAAPMLAGARA